MTVAGAPKDVSSSAIYLPQINRALVDQLETHLRTLCLPAAERSMSLVNDLAHYPTQLRADQLESTLRCVKCAAHTMTTLSETALASSEAQSKTKYFEERLVLFEQAFAAVSAELIEARSIAEEFRCRSYVAEEKLKTLMEAVAKMVEPLNRQTVSHCAQEHIYRYSSSQDDEVHA